MDIPTLVTARLILRGFRAADHPALAAIQADPETMRFLGVGEAAGRPRSPAETWQGMAALIGQWTLRGYGSWAVEEARSGALVGRVGILHPWDWPEPELAYLLDRAAWGHGYATEACRAALDWAFATQAWPRLVSYIRPDNAASARVAARLGAVDDGPFELLGAACRRWVHPRPGRGAVA